MPTLIMPTLEQCCAAVCACVHWLSMHNQMHVRTAAGQQTHLCGTSMSTIDALHQSHCMTALLQAELKCTQLD